MFELPSGFTDGIGTKTTGVLSALSSPFQLILGVLLATLVIAVIIKAIKH